MAEARFPARYYDGQNAVAHAVTAAITAPDVDIVDAGGELLARWPRDSLRLSGSIAETGAVTLTSTAAPEARLLVADAGAARRLAQLLPQAVETHRRRNRRIVASYAGITVAVLALGAGLVQFLPNIAAPLVPFETKRAIGRSAFDGWLGAEPLCYALEGASPLKRLADRLKAAAGIDHPLKVLVIDSSVVNAFAFPGGIVVLTRGLIANAGGPDEVAGVLAHEIGHVKLDHPTVGMLRTMGISALLQLLSGGAGMETIANAGGALAFLSYSRGAEAEADAAAVEILDRAGLNADGLSRFFARWRHTEDDGSIAGWLPGWFSTHPSAEARRQATARDATGAPALDAEGWAGLRAICTPWKEG